MSASFLEIQLPPFVSQGAVGGMRFSTSITPLSSGFEQRNINWAKSRGEWDLAKGMQTQEQIGALVDHFAAVRGKAYGWRMRAWEDYRLPRWRSTPGDMGGLPVFMTTNGVTNTFQLKKIYSAGGVNYERIITKPCDVAICAASSNPYPLHLLNNGSPTSDFTVNTATGIVTLGATLAATTGRTIAGACEFDVPVRFDTDDMKIAITTLEMMGWQAIPVVEVRDI